MAFDSYLDCWGELYNPIKEIKKGEYKMTFEEWLDFNRKFFKGNQNYEGMNALFDTIVVILSKKNEIKIKIPLFKTNMAINTCSEVFGDLEISDFGVYCNPFDEDKEEK